MIIEKKEKKKKEHTYVYPDTYVPDTYVYQEEYKHIKIKVYK